MNSDKLFDFKRTLGSGLYYYRVKNFCKNSQIANVMGIEHCVLNNWLNKSLTSIPNYLQMKYLETVLEIDLSHYYPTSCPIILDFIERRIKSGLKKSEINRIMNSNKSMLAFIESSKYSDLNETQLESYNKINIWLNKS